MGCYIYHAGTVNISKDKAAEFERNILHIFDIGGMMQVEVAELFEKRLFLIHPIEPDESSGNYRASFNYFEDNMHEEAGYSPSSHYFYSNKIGSFAFNHVILLCQLMQELYGGGNCLIYGDIDGSLVKYTSWINRTFGTTFDLAHRTDLLHVYRVLQEEKWMDPKNIDCIEDFLVDCKISSIGALMDAYIETHSVLETLRFFKSRYSRNPWIKNVGRWMYQLTHAFVQKRRTSSQSVDEQIREALSYRSWQEQHPYVEPPSNLKPFVYSAILPVNTVFHLIAYAYPSLSYEEARTRYGTYLTGCPPISQQKSFRSRHVRSHPEGEMQPQRHCPLRQR